VGLTRELFSKYQNNIALGHPTKKELLKKKVHKSLCNLSVISD